MDTFEFFGEGSFYETLYEDAVWDFDKYWLLECQLIEIAKDVIACEEIDKSLAKNLFYLGYSTEDLVGASKSPADISVIENFDNDAEYLFNRLRKIIKMIWSDSSQVSLDMIREFSLENKIYHSDE